MFLQPSQTDSELLQAIPHGEDHLFSPHPHLPSAQRYDQEADPSASARVPVGLLPRTQLNQLLRALPGLQGIEKDYHKLMFTL